MLLINIHEIHLIHVIALFVCLTSWLPTNLL